MLSDRFFILNDDPHTDLSIPLFEWILGAGLPHWTGGVWRDWVEVDWGDGGYLPCKIWGFADLRGLPANSGISFASLSNIYPSVYAIVECGLHYAKSRLLIM